MAQLRADSYGKSDVRLTKVTRRGEFHQLTEMSVSVELRGEFASCYLAGDNSSIIPTDTQKNTVYALARKHEFTSIEQFALILGSAGGPSLGAAIAHIEAKGTIVVFGNSSGEPTTISFADFRGAPNSRVQSFSYFYSEAEDRFAPDLALLVSLIADGSLRPQIGLERSWRDFAPVAGQLRDRRVAGKAVFSVVGWEKHRWNSLARLR